MGVPHSSAPAPMSHQGMNMENINAVRTPPTEFNPQFPSHMFTPQTTQAAVAAVASEILSKSCIPQPSNINNASTPKDESGQSGGVRSGNVISGGAVPNEDGDR